MRKIGDLVDHARMNARDRIDAVETHPDGTQIARLDARDKWVFAQDTVPVAPK